MAVNQDLSKIAPISNMQHIPFSQSFSQIQHPIGLSISQSPNPIGGGGAMSQPLLQPQPQQYYPQMMQNQPMLLPTPMQQQQQPQPQKIAVETPPLHFPLQEPPVSNSPSNLVERKVEVVNNPAVKHEEVEVEELISFD